MEKQFTTKSSGVIRLNMEEMQVISETFQVEGTKGYLYENCPNWSEEKVDWVAREAREIMRNADSSEEVEAIVDAADNYRQWCINNLSCELSKLSQDYDFYEYSDVFESETAAVEHIREMLSTKEGIESLLKFCADILSEENEQEEVKPKAKELQERLLKLKKGV